MKYFTIFTFVCLIILTGCMDNFLSNEPEDSLSPENFYENEEDAVAAIYSVYERLGTKGLYNLDGVMYILANASDQTRPFGANAERVALDDYSYTELNTITSTWWKTSFQIINRANAVTDNVPGIQMDESMRAGIVGEAKFLRALAYFNLVRMYGKVPVITQETESFEDIKKPRASKDSIYAQIIRDLEDAEEVLPDEYNANNEGRATAGAAKTLLAKVYLTRERWQEAADKAKEVMDSGNYELFEDYAHVFLPEYENGKEHIFSIQFHAGDQNAGKQGRFWTYTAPNARKTGGLSVAGGGSSFGAIFPEISFYEEYPDDYRKEVNFFTEWTFSEKDTTVTFEPHFLKYHDPGQTQSKRSSVNFPLFRYADVLLMYAEAANEANGGPTTQAYEALNKVRQRARFDRTDSVLPDLSGLTQTGFRDAVLQERNWELAGEGKRWFDLKRTGRLVEELQADGKNIQETNRLFPLPKIELELNNDWKQNPGY
ncbi:RagB/SusD family nutrient uptake outer membrane protein [Fodinibius salsisoli]|uniref:RagB/SusD family nutrient uptake outer membrane protein n=1 Tax=Fodinibius salsisoli TaxID=2820877 RepID=A0ABT3PS73_9BACT|nr:RagB/SusD family nutrient uptake outer membrane protein [Fodinibius salsisoli]MCW9708708.1 RagB/SusD family nutrient uptake outer membrane protein [Fodinibius salsisoli]